MALLTDLDLDRLIEAAPKPVTTADGQLTFYDRMIYYWAAKTLYTGRGTIVDAGALVGGTTTCLGEGLMGNPAVPAGRHAMHVYDLFQDEPDGFTAATIRGWYKEEKDPSDAIYDFEQHFTNNTRKYANIMTVHKGDVSRATYNDERPVEVLGIDLAKSADLMLAVAKIFFPHLIPGKSIVIHQDYIFPFQPWLHIAMELMSDLLPKVYDVPNHCSAVFVPTRRITVKQVEARLGHQGSDFYNLDHVRCIYAAIDRARPGFGKFVHTAALSYFYYMMDERATAIQVALRMIDEHKVTARMVEHAALASFLRDDLDLDYEKLCM